MFAKKNLLELIGNTPMTEIKMDSETIYAKMENLNPSGSIKDRIAKYMIEDAEKRGILKPGMTIVEPTSGNTGIALSFVSSIKGYEFIAVIPEFASKERIEIMKHYGAKVVLTRKEIGVKGAVEKAKKLAERLNGFMPNQFENENNVLAHKETTGKEILEQVKNVDVFVAGVGTGGTLIGVAKALKEKNPNVKIIGVEPASSPLLSKGKVGHHKIEGIGEDFIPKIVENNLELIDQIIVVTDKEAIQTSRRLAREGLFVGISSGANVSASLKIAKKLKNKKVVTVLPDSADRYYSTELFP
ncbi:MAG: cysteine synthase A [Candidatus Aenigmarchaeota archaeon CG_4_10_14_0_8_um_filter_37_24]|nr:cysteine synthase A [Candidatus Aenigmarchaeota archaeon]PIV68220.1 MAG: cysteine synthase A [Candidatus Aenigmarchaeota archaeon CG01_land_8_20_14_3_00_37_9]PIW41563.1 MAG: cysteine synthase A [Candidatus Aenigmarchaeota archaeon CG15_BIG_FIL_POST_REV_8_21_14_020_37_27]PIX51112.1 MAG: cysteine synthase A [Candidatus Aenigmarchaeota archaeon CG_4_8_14_3_um_filter_37_24]PIZ35035.1 MAG: cysteine synthase A [Candidatus Aenigmarchaeota archaeon CG_4_10_14_0_8_um_filter_37_24]PJB74836.1 MAG: cys